MLTMSPASFSSPAKSNQHDCPFCTCRGVNDFLISPPEEKKHTLFMPGFFVLLPKNGISMEPEVSFFFHS